MNKDIEYMKIAIQLSKEGSFPYGTIVVKDDKIISKASSGEGEVCDPTNHAETLAIRQACKKLNTNDLTGCTVYSSSEPCFMCFGTIWWANISRIVYGADINETNNILGTDIQINIAELNKKTGNKIEILGGVSQDEALQVLKSWNRRAE